jgi:TatD DNase family protein
MTIPSYIDIHTHREEKDPEVFSVRNIYPFSVDREIQDMNNYFSSGIHPWHINENTSHDLRLLEQIASEKQIIAIGETGLDKLAETDFSLQENIFIRHIQIAEKVNKPLVVHCVKAWNETIHILNKMKVKVPVIFHGFRSKPQLACELIESGYFLSFGNFFNRNSLQVVPDERLFLETDDKNYSIQDIYRNIAEEKNISIEDLQKMIKDNFEKCFRL